jgi:V8-like Glu-specific endopeptidase
MTRNTTNSIAATTVSQAVSRLFIAALGVMVCLLAFAAVTPTFAQGRVTERPSDRTKPTDEDTVLVKPLAASDPRAKLDPELLNVPAKPLPVYATSGESLGPEADGMVEYNVKTGVATDRTANPITVPEFVESAVKSGQALMPGSVGANLQQDTADARGARPKTESVIGTDERIKITNTAVYPWRAITKLYMTFPNGLTYSCSGTMVNPKYVLTAGHCVFSSADGGWAKTITVIPGLNGTYKPYGQTTATYMRSYTGWTVSGSSNHDFGLITLASPLGSSTGWFGLKSYSSVDGLSANLAGYPGDKDGGLGLYYGFGPITSSTAYRVFYSIDTYGGQSGSGVYHIEPGTLRYVFAVHTTGYGTYNGGTRIDSSKFSSIVSWMASGY